VVFTIYPIWYHLLAMATVKVRAAIGIRGYGAAVQPSLDLAPQSSKPVQHNDTSWSERYHNRATASRGYRTMRNATRPPPAPGGPRARRSAERSPAEQRAATKPWRAGFSPREALASLPTSGAKAPRGLKSALQNRREQGRNPGLVVHCSRIRGRTLETEYLVQGFGSE
jgi:hypothetical protein